MSQRSSSFRREQRADREREGHGEADVPEVQERRVGEHVRVLQARASCPRRPRARLVGERARDGDEEEREEGGDGREDRNDPDDQVARPASIQAHGGRAEAGEHEQPEEQRALLPSPERGDRVRRRQRLARRPGDVREREVVPQERGEEDRGGDGGRRERRDERVLRGRASRRARGGLPCAPATSAYTDRPRVTRSAARPSSGMRGSGGVALLRRVLRRALVIIEPGSATNVPLRAARRRRCASRP